MRGLKGFFKIFSSFKNRKSALNCGKRTKQVALSVLALFLTVSIVLAVPETLTTMETSLNPSTQVSTKAIDKALVNKTYGVMGIDSGYHIQQTSDGNYIMVGVTVQGAGSWDVWLIKTYKNGNVWWNHTHGGSGSDQGYWVEQAKDGGYIITGYTWSYGSPFPDVWLLKTDHAGEEVWNRTFGGVVDDYDYGKCVKQTVDEGYIIVGYTESYGAGNEDVWLIKTNKTGHHQWNQTYGGIYNDRGHCVLQTADGGYLITGYKDEFSGSLDPDVWLIKTDENGTILWDKTFGGSDYDVGYCVLQTSDDGYIIVGRSDSFGVGSVKVWLIKTDENGNEDWNQTYGETGWHEGLYIDQTYDGGYIITGKTRSNSGSFDVWVIKTDENGYEQWNKIYGGDYDDVGQCVQQTTDKEYIIVGYTKSYGSGNEDVWLIKPDGDPIIDHPNDINYVEGTTGNIISWNPSDENPSNYEVTREGIPVNSSSWDGGSITLNVDGLPIGNYTYKCTVYDVSSQNASDTVKVTVIEAEEVPDDDDDEFPWTTFSLALAVIGIAVLILFVKYKRKS